MEERGASVHTLLDSLTSLIQNNEELSQNFFSFLRKIHFTEHDVKTTQSFSVLFCEFYSKDSFDNSEQFRNDEEPDEDTAEIFRGLREVLKEKFYRGAHLFV